MLGAPCSLCCCCEDLSNGGYTIYDFTNDCWSAFDIWTQSVPPRAPLQFTLGYASRCLFLPEGNVEIHLTAVLSAVGAGISGLNNVVAVAIGSESDSISPNYDAAGSSARVGFGVASNPANSLAQIGASTPYTSANEAVEAPFSGSVTGKFSRRNGLWYAYHPQIGERQVPFTLPSWQTVIYHGPTGTNGPKTVASYSVSITCDEAPCNPLP